MSAEKFSQIFSGLEVAYGTYEIQRQQSNGKQAGQANVIKQPRTKETWEGHLSGKGPAIGIIPINENNMCKWGCIDVDQYSGFNHKELIDKITEMKLPLVVCRSKSGGAHVFMFCTDWISAKELQDTLSSISAALGYSGSEIFPKQITFLIFLITITMRAYGTPSNLMAAQLLFQSLLICMSQTNRP